MIDLTKFGLPSTDTFDQRSALLLDYLLKPRQRFRVFSGHEYLLIALLHRRNKGIPRRWIIIGRNDGTDKNFAIYILLGAISERLESIYVKLANYYNNVEHSTNKSAFIEQNKDDENRSRQLADKLAMELILWPWTSREQHAIRLHGDVVVSGSTFTGPLTTPYIDDFIRVLNHAIIIEIYKRLIQAGISACVKRYGRNLFLDIQIPISVRDDSFKKLLGSGAVLTDPSTWEPSAICGEPINLIIQVDGRQLILRIIFIPKTKTWAVFSGQTRKVIMYNRTLSSREIATRYFSTATSAQEAETSPTAKTFNIYAVPMEATGLVGVTVTVIDEVREEKHHPSFAYRLVDENGLDLGFITFTIYPVSDSFQYLYIQALNIVDRPLFRQYVEALLALVNRKELSIASPIERVMGRHRFLIYSSAPAIEININGESFTLSPSFLVAQKIEAQHPEHGHKVIKLPPMMRITDLRSYLTAPAYSEYVALVNKLVGRKLIKEFNQRRKKRPIATNPTSSRSGLNN